MNKYRIAQYGSSEQKEFLLHDKDPVIRCLVAQYGTDGQRDKLIQDDDFFVRLCVLYFGNRTHWELLQHDKNNDISNIAKFKLKHTL